MQLNIPFSSEIIIGVTLIGFGVYTFAKGASNHMANDNYIKCKNQINHINKLADTIIESKSVIPKK